MSVGRTVLGLACDCRCCLGFLNLIFYLYCPSLNAFFVCVVLVCFSVQCTKLCCIPEVRALQKVHYN